MNDPKVLIISADVHVQSLFELILSRSMDVSCESISDYSFASNILSDFECHFIVIHLIEDEKVSLLMEKLKDLAGRPRVLFACENKDLSIASGLIGSYGPHQKVTFDRSEDEIMERVRDLLDDSSAVKEKSEYCKMGIDMFSASKKTKYDLFLKISEKKFLKIFHKDEIVSSADVNKYLKKGIKFFWLKSDDFQAVTGSLINRLNNFMKLRDVSVPDLTQFSMMSFDSATQLVANLGISEEVVEITTQALEMTTQLVQKNPKLKDLLNKMLSNKNYPSEHSLMLSFVSCSIAKELDMHSLDTTKKLCYAAFFHDLEIKDERMAGIANLKGDEEEIYGSEQYNNFLNHPLKAAELVDSVTGLPPDVGRIIAQHHERPDGSGFPLGLNEKKIFPLAANFIVAEDFVNSLYELGPEDAVVEEIIELMEGKYTSGYFKKSVEALKKSLGIKTGFGFSLFNKKSA